MNEATAQNSHLLTWTVREMRMLSLAFADGRTVSATVFQRHWRPIVSIALRGAPADLRRFMNCLSDGPLAIASLPVCAETMSLLRLLRIVAGQDLETAQRVAEGWMQLPVHERAEGRFIYRCPRVVQAQLLGLIEGPSPIIPVPIPHQFQIFIDAANYSGLSTFFEPCWASADTVLGSTAMVFANPSSDRLDACMAISDCKVSYPPMNGGGLPEAHRAVQVLLDHIPTVIADDDAHRLAGWHPAGHEVMEIVDFLEVLKTRFG